MRKSIDYIFNITNIILNNKICNTITLKKIKSHHSKDGIFYGNYIADLWANHASSIVKYNYKEFFNVSFDSQLTQWHAIIKYRNANKWHKMVNDHKRNKNILLKMIYKYVPKCNNKMYDIFKYFKRKDASIIMKL